MARFSIIALIATAVLACSSKSDDKTAAKPVDVNARCEQLAKLCADTDKHIAKLLEECTQAAGTQRPRGCLDQAFATYDCYEKEVCGKTDKVWTLDDLRVLTERHNKCAAQRDALRACVDK